MIADIFSWRVHMVRRRNNSSDDMGIKDIFTLVVVASIVAVLFMIAWAILMLITYWYVSLPIAISLLYLHYRTRPDDALKPTSATKVILSSNTTEQGVTKSKTTITYDKPGSSLLSGISGLLHILSANIR
jgi:hypothetical protein